ncbi:MAG: 2-C-methyl-D-erythritol 4-phosphate cytidylyltransferase, partial [Nitrospinales bacterium]
MNRVVKAGVVIAAAGSGERFGEKKQFKLLRKRPLLFHTLNPFVTCSDISEIVVVVPEENLELFSRELKSFTSAKSVRAIIGGARRQDSVLNGCLALSEDVEIIAVHDAARPFVTSKLISETIAGCRNTD